MLREGNNGGRKYLCRKLGNLTLHILTDEECVKDLIDSYYSSCPYVYPFSDDLMNRLYSLCRYRVTSGRLLIPSCNSYSFKVPLLHGN